MEKEDEITISKVLDMLVGRLSFMQTRWEQRQIVQNLLREIGVPSEKIDKMARDILAYDKIEEFIYDPTVEDIIINGLNPIFVSKTTEGIVKTDKRFESLDELNLLVKKLLIFSGKHKLEPINNLHLPEGGRVNIVRSSFGPQITIRRFRQTPMSMIDLVENGTMPYNIAAQMWLYADGFGIKPANILIGGMPGAGKTTLLNALFSFFPTNERVVVIEDTLELNTECIMENCSRLECADDLTMEELVKNSLRMRPDRIIVGEVRGAEAWDLMTAMNIGKICMGTIHANTSREVVLRLQNKPMNVSPEIIPLIDVIIIVRKLNIKGRIFRTVFSLTEVAGLEHDTVLLSDYCKYDVKECKIVEAHPSVTYRDRLAEASGYSPKEIMDEVEIRSKILQILCEKNKKKITDISEFCARYYKNPEDAVESLGYKIKVSED